MKRILIAITLLCLVACGPTEEEFIETYNEIASSPIEDTGQTRTNDAGTFQLLYESETYRIESKYEDDELSGYFIAINDTEYTELKGESYEAALTIVKTLELDPETFKEETRKAFKSEEIPKHSIYKENGYEIQILPGEISGEPKGLFIHFNKD